MIRIPYLYGISMSLWAPASCETVESTIISHFIIPSRMILDLTQRSARGFPFVRTLDHNENGGARSPKKRK
ncbi:hypothetical protein BDQ17DRAFT_1350053, partial [Cyathus striatus]